MQLVRGENDRSHQTLKQETYIIEKEMSGMMSHRYIYIISTYTQRTDISIDRQMVAYYRREREREKERKRESEKERKRERERERESTVQ